MIGKVQVKGMPKKIYIAGPYTKPDPGSNTYEAVRVGNKLLELGFCPYIPHLTYFWNAMSPKTYKEWLDYDFQWVTSCDGLLRIPGESPGADKEVQYAYLNEIPVFENGLLCHRIEDMIGYFKGSNQ